MHPFTSPALRVTRAYPSCLGAKTGSRSGKDSSSEQGHAEGLTTTHTYIHTANIQSSVSLMAPRVRNEPMTSLAARRQCFTVVATQQKMIMILNYMSTPDYLIKFAF